MRRSIERRHSATNTTLNHVQTRHIHSVNQIKVIMDAIVSTILLSVCPSRRQILKYR
jgi:hypothetical protein